MQFKTIITYLRHKLDACLCNISRVAIVRFQFIAFINTRIIIFTQLSIIKLTNGSFKYRIRCLVLLNKTYIQLNCVYNSMTFHLDFLLQLKYSIL